MTPPKKRVRGRPKGTTRANGYKVGGGRPKTITPPAMAKKAPVSRKKRSDAATAQLLAAELTSTSSNSDPSAPETPAMNTDMSHTASGAGPTTAGTPAVGQVVEQVSASQLSITVPELHIELPALESNSEEAANEDVTGETSGRHAGLGGGGIKRKRTPEVEKADGGLGDALRYTGSGLLLTATGSADQPLL